MRFQRGKPRPPGAGRKVGSRNRATRAFKEAVSAVFRQGGGENWLLRWAKRHPTEFFAIAARLAPKEIDLTEAGDLSTGVCVVRLPDNSRGPVPGESDAQFQARTAAKDK